MDSTSSEPLPPNTTLSPTWMVLYYVLCSIALMLMLVRFYGRFKFKDTWGWDDFFVLLGWLCLFVGLVLSQIEANWGLGRHYVYIANAETVMNIIRLNTGFVLVNVLCALFAKISISFFILRIRNTKKIRLTLSILMLFMTLATVQAVIINCVACVPTAKLWNPTIPGQCLPANTIQIAASVQSAFTIVTDLALTLSPIIILWNVRIPRKQKWQICGLMSLGLVATCANAARNAFSYVTHSPDFTYEITPVTVLAVLELSSGMIAANIPACMPVFRYARHKHGIKSQTSSIQSGSQNNEKTRPGTTRSSSKQPSIEKDLSRNTEEEPFEVV